MAKKSPFVSLQALVVAMANDDPRASTMVRVVRELGEYFKIFPFADQVEPAEFIRGCLVKPVATGDEEEDARRLHRRNQLHLPSRSKELGNYRLMYAAVDHYVRLSEARLQLGLSIIRNAVVCDSIKVEAKEFKDASFDTALLLLFGRDAEG